MRLARRLSIAALLTLSSTTSIAGDWPWREQVEFTPADSRAVWVRLGTEIPALDYTLWREQAYRSELPLLITLPAHEAAPQSALMWQEQVTLPPLNAKGAPVIRMSGGEAKAGPTRRR